MRRILFAFALVAITSVCVGQSIGSSQVMKKVVIGYNDTTHLSFLRDSTLFTEGWDTLAQPKFWRNVISMSGDTCVINIASCRKPVDKIDKQSWKNLSEECKSIWKDSVRMCNNLEAGTELFVTTGKAEFYELKKVLPDISRAIKVFEQNNVDPWYAQTIMLIESPGRMNARSTVGAKGPFQLMRSTARRLGLVVNKKRDDRTDFTKSAKAAAKLINTAFIPLVKSYLDEQHLAYKETDLWFRLLVLHAYHAGPGNVHCVLNSIAPDKGGVDLIAKVWQTQCRGFKNESQNYSQIALASLLNFNDLIQLDGDTIYLVQGDKYFKRYKRKQQKPAEAFTFLNKCLTNYENDLVDGTIGYDYFLKRITQVRKEFSFIATHISRSATDVVLNQYPATEEQVYNLALRLLRKQRCDEAINILKLNLDSHPNSSAAFENLARAYSFSGNKQLATIFNNRSMAAREKEQRNFE
jgi:hypothetical protein